MTVVFATNAQDAQELCLREGLEFESVVWVMNAQLLGTTADGKDVTAHYTELFKTAPAYPEALDRFGPAPQ